MAQCNNVFSLITYMHMSDNFEVKLQGDHYKAERFKASFLDSLIVEVGPKICSDGLFYYIPAYFT